MKRKNRFGVSLAEMLLFTGLAVLVSGVAVEFYVRGTGVTDATQKAILVQQDIRAVVEYFTRDMNATYWVLEPPSGDRAHNVCLVKFASANSTERLKENLLEPANRLDYPFFRDNQPVGNRIDAYLISYTYDENTHTVKRKEDKGLFIIATNSSAIAHAIDYTFEVHETLSDRVLGKNVKQFDLDYFGYERSVNTSHLPGLLKNVFDLNEVETLSDAVKMGRTACILLKVRASYEEGVYSEKYKQRGHRAPETELVTKVWSNVRLRDEMYHEYWSSTDWNLQY